MTAQELVAAGFSFSRAGAHVVARAPKGRTDLVEAFRAEVSRRVPRLGDLKAARNLAAPRGRCETCGDPMALYLAGMCDLCVAARCKAIARQRETLW
jgi:hypothetical protein